jgi:hypothetical protein
MSPMSNRDRIARAAEEARLSELEKAAKRAAKKKAPGAPRPKRVPVPVRMKIVWDVVGSTGATVKTFAYPDKELAEAAAESLSRSTGRSHVLRANKVPMV